MIIKKGGDYQNDYQSDYQSVYFDCKIVCVDSIAKQSIITMAHKLTINITLTTYHTVTPPPLTTAGAASESPPVPATSKNTTITRARPTLSTYYIISYPTILSTN